MIIYVKNMVSSRCKLKVKKELEKLGMNDAKIQLGKVELTNLTSDGQIEKLRSALALSGLEVLYDKNVELVEQIKRVVRKMIDEPVDEPYCEDITNSEYISEKLNKSYSYLARVFVEVTGISIGQFIIGHRITHTKVLIRQNILTLSEIAYRLNYSSIGHLSNQFKQVTGISPSVYRKIVRIGLSESWTDVRLMMDLPRHTFIESLNKSGIKQEIPANK